MQRKNKWAFYPREFLLMKPLKIRLSGKMIFGSESVKKRVIQVMKRVY